MHTRHKQAIQKHLQLHASQVRQKAQYSLHPLHRYTTHNTSQQLMKPTTFNNTNIHTDPCTVTTADIKANMRDIYTSIVSQHLATRDNNKTLRTHPPQVSITEENLPRHTRRTLAQLRTNISPFLYIIYTQNRHLNTSITTLPPLALSRTHHTTSLQLPTDTHHAVGPGFVEGSLHVAVLLDDWREKLAANPHKETETDSPNKQGEVGRQQQQQQQQMYKLDKKNKAQ